MEISGNLKNPLNHDLVPILLSKAKRIFISEKCFRDLL